MRQTKRQKFNIISSVAVATISLFSAGISAQAATELAKVNGKPITEKDVQQALTGMSESQRAALLKDPVAKKQIVSTLADQEVLIQEAEKLKIDQSQPYKDALIAFRRQFLAAQVLERGVSPKVTDTTARKYFEAHKRRFSTDQIHVQHILVSDELQARDMLKKAQAPQADFQELAEKFSKDPSAKRNRGDLGVIGRDSPLVEEFKAPAFDAPKDSIVGPVKTAFGYHIIKVVDKKIGRPMEYDEVELKVKGEMRDEFVKDYMAQLKKQAKVQIN